MQPHYQRCTVQQWERFIPDFSAIGDLLGGITSILDGIVGLTGSLTGEGTLDALEGIGSSFGEGAAE